MTPEPTTAIIVVAAGSGTRLGHAEPKAFVPVSGRSILERALETLFELAEPVQVIVVAPSTHLDATRVAARTVAGIMHEAVTVTVGGPTRQASVAAGLAAVDPAVDVVLVHDAARALTPRAQFVRVLDAVRSTGHGIIPGLPVADTIKRRDAADLVLATVDRSELVAVQTPQGFPRTALTSAYAAADAEHTDDAALFAAAGNEVHLVDGDPMAFKITTPWDLRRAEGLLGSPSGLRTGVGVDVHAFDPAEPLWLAGLHWPGEVGLSGHSDGDAVSHAICDALLSAAGLGDIGGHFGTAEAHLAGAHGTVFLHRTVELLRDAGVTVLNVAVQVISNRPKLSPRRAEAEALLSRAVGAPVSLAATTSDGLGFTGTGEGLTAIATALVTSAGVPSGRK
ncbi:2-C-methyl-D-erythritol 4-phosphate cytidylyltransferase [Planctomonas psychrotolerans]|uniref:2-C-methyl-D-erythritol 4-phosphate cytidylyltransferase n=1 Tax=Planctomonas psychrotolerans TaxID=2528712 RepID=UPI001239E274|nr:2-C-methyl-D-erythritol 4-phosphate cytidylyltransferase [Planctomonas psychrotolerans]